jgi:hypothetical protein
MIEDGRAFGLTIAMKHLLNRLEDKEIVTAAERQKMLDAALNEMYEVTTLSSEAKVQAGRGIGYLFVR